MIQRLKKITNGLYRGSAPSPKEVLWLKDTLGIKKIVSLDRETGDKISRACDMLDIQQAKMYIDGNKSSLLHLFSQDLKKLLLEDGPTYIHCHHGKDRTGLLAAVFKVKYMGMDPEKAIREAKSLGFGIGVNPAWVQLYEKIIRACKPDKDSHDADIVSNVREGVGDSKDSYLDVGHQGSFAPHLDKTKQYPIDVIYNPINDQSPTRENYNQDKSIKEHDPEQDVIPQVGVFNNDAGGRGFGPVENAGGFFYD